MYPYKNRTAVPVQNGREVRARGMPAIEGGGCAASIEGGGSAASIEGANAPYEDWLRQYFYPLLNPQTKNEPPMKGSYTLPKFVKKTKAPRFGVMLLDAGRV